MSSKARACKNLRRSPREPSSSRKRTTRESPITPSPGPKRKCIGRKSHDGRDIDRYCWVCHKSDENAQQNICFTCPRVFHTVCLEKGSNVFSDNNVCPECQMNSIDGTRIPKGLTLQMLKDLLLATTKQKIKDKEFAKFKMFFSWPQNNGHSELVRVFDFQILIDKINDTVPYTKTSEFLSDIKWIQHNCSILFGPTSKVSDAALKLVKAFKTDLLDLEACPECYYHMIYSKSSDFFVRVCKSPHDIVWAQVCGYSYWPAKCLKIVNGIAHVRFFGRHEIGKIPIGQCYYMSRDHPNHPQKNVPKTPNYNAAMIELNQYIGIFERKFGAGAFHYYEPKTAFKPENAIPKPVIDPPEEPPPRPQSDKPNITTMPSCINPTDDGSAEPGTSSSDDSAFTEEMDRMLEEDNNSHQTIDLGICTETTVVDSTPILASEDIAVSQIDLNLGEFSQTHLVHESHNETMTYDDTSENRIQTVSIIEQVPSPQTIEPVPSTSTGSGCYVVSPGPSSAISPYDDDDVDDVIVLNNDTRICNRNGQVDEGMFLTYLSTHGLNMVDFNKQFRTLIYSLFMHLLNIRRSDGIVYTNSIANITNQMDSFRDMYDNIHDENNDLRIHISDTRITHDRLTEEIDKLKRALEEEKRKSLVVIKEFTDVTSNAKMVVDSVKRSCNKYWARQIKDINMMHRNRVSEKEKTIEELMKEVEALKRNRDKLEAQKNEMEAEHKKKLSELSKSLDYEKVYQETQTELCSSNVLSRAELDNILEENRKHIVHDMEHTVNEEIIQAKRNTFCYICLKPANIHCCMSANYCTKTCQRKNKSHYIICQKKIEVKSRPETELPQPNQFCPPMMNQLNPLQAFQSRETTSIESTSIRVQMKKVVATAAATDPNPFANSSPVSSDQKS